MVDALARIDTNARSIAAQTGPEYLHQVSRQYLKARKVLLDAGLLRA